MSGFEVAPVDAGSSAVLPPGETMIGRGPLLGISDKRVSRNHAILKVTGDQLCIKPVHVNPCFYWPSENSQPLPLDSGEWHQLSPGDNFSLLVDKYIFRVVFTHTAMKGLKSRDSGNLEAEEMPDKAPPRQSSLQTTSSSHAGKLPEAYYVLERTAETPRKLCTSVAESEKQKFASRKRVLPAWMLQHDLMVPSSSSLVPGRGNNEEREKRSGKKPKTAGEDAGLSVQNIQRVTTESAVPKLEKNNSKVVPQIPKCSMMQNECLEPNQPGLQAIERDVCNKREIKEESATCQIEDQGTPSSSPIHQDENAAFILDQTTETDISDVTGSSDIQQSSNVSKPKRIPCQYGKNCYRKNPAHFQQFSHPGDRDYLDAEVVTPADNDHRPECPYGTACYRKNPQHKIEYKHTAPPEPERRQTRPKPVKKERSGLGDDSDNDGEPNEYDLNDSFIDDEEEEECDPTDEDSDWEPGFEEDDEDVGTLLKEAHKFVKTKK